MFVACVSLCHCLYVCCIYCCAFLFNVFLFCDLFVCFVRFLCAGSLLLLLLVLCFTCIGAYLVYL